MHPFSGDRRFLRVARVLGATAGKSAVRSSLPLYFATGVGATVLFAGNGLSARTVALLGFQHPAFRISLSLVWALATLPLARVLLATPETFFLRTLPVATSEFLALVAAALALAHLPYGVLWARGADVGAGFGAAVAVLAVQVHWLAGLRNLRDAATAALALLAFVLPPSATTAAIGCSAFVPGLYAAWTRAPEPRSAGRHSVSTRSRSLALASALAVSLYRGHAAQMLRALLLASAACLAGLLGLRNNFVSDLTTITRVALSVWGPACVLGTVGLAGPMLNAEAKASWILEVCGVSGWLRSASGAGLLATWAAIAGVVMGLVMGDSLGLEAARATSLGLHLAGAGAAWAAAATAIVRLVRSGGGRDAGRLLLSLSGLAIISAVLLALPLALGVVLLLVLAACLVVAATRARIPGELLEDRLRC